jgi:hypothetical protein
VDDFDGIQWNGMRLTIDLRPIGDDVEAFREAMTAPGQSEALQQAVMDALPPGDVLVHISLRRLIG